MLRGLIVSIIFVFLSACAVTPTVFNRALDGSPTIVTVGDDVSSHIGSKIRWGGTLLSIKNQQDNSWLEILEYPLYRNGKPKLGSESRGRFFAKITGFLDPEVYEQGREITVFGVLNEDIKQKIGDFDYAYPVVDVLTENQRLWRETEQNTYHSLYLSYPWWGYHPHFYNGLRTGIIIQKKTSK